MKERPILFSGPMVRAVLDGRKTQTRRIVKKQPITGDAHETLDAGDRLWVRETFEIRGYGAYQDVKLRYVSDGRADYRRIGSDDADKNYRPAQFRKIPSIHMPRWASRITLELTKVRVERLQDISEQDCADEGIIEIHRSLYRHGKLNGYGLPGTPPEEAASTRRNAYADLWDSLHGKGAWDKNPWVWVVEFSTVKGK